MSKVVAVLEVMWNWKSKTTSAGYAKQAPKWFTINPDNHTGRRLYEFIGHNDLLVTNACPELVGSAKGRGKPDRKWLQDNLDELLPFNLLLVCGKVAQATYRLSKFGGARIIELPHPAARGWRKQDLSFAERLIQSECRRDLELSFRKGHLIATDLVPF